MQGILKHKFWMLLFFGVTLIVFVAACDNPTGSDSADGAPGGGDAGETTFQIGGTGQAGGIVFYDKGSYSDGWRYLEAWTADEDEGARFKWKTDFTGTPGTSTALGSGYENTYSAMTGPEHPAAEVVRNATHGGYDDWFLPSKNELAEMQNLRMEGLGDFVTSDEYWSSSQYDDSAGTVGEWEVNAWVHSFVPTIPPGPYGKGFEHNRVRAVRAF